MSDDRELLAEFCQGGSEKAFRQLVDRHLGLVYSAALRLVNGDSHAAEDITQLVFTNLARKAADLPPATVLPGWLHRDARYTALEWIRAERRRAVREQKATFMQETPSSPDEIDWARVRPVLDEVLGELSDDDRDVLLLRFFGENNLRSIGAALGISEDAARKRVTRALDKLRGQLGNRGITASATALALGLAVHGAPTRPAKPVDQLAHGALVSAGVTSLKTLSLLAIMTSTKTVTGIAAAALLLVTGTVILRHHSAQRETELTKSLPAPNWVSAKTSTETQRLLVKPSPAKEAFAPLKITSSVEAALVRLRELLYDPKRTQNYPDRAIVDAIAALGDQKRAALPMLREALKDASVEVRCRAADGLRQLRNEGREAIPDLLAALREPTSGIEVSLFFNAIEEIGASPELIPDIISILKSNPDARLMIAASLSNPNWGNPGDIAPFLRPLLGDPDSSIRMAAAYSLALLLRHEAGPEAVAAAVEALQGANSELHSVALAVLRNIGSDPSDPQGHFQASRLPASAAAAVPALAGIINNPETPSNMRQDALRILNGLQPDASKVDPALADAMRHQQAEESYRRRLRADQVDLPDLIAGMKLYPDSAGLTAEALANQGKSAVEALPALRQALEDSLQRTMTLNLPVSEVSVASRTRDTLADAIQRISPDQPKAYFTTRDLGAIFAAFKSYSDQADQGQLRQIMTVVHPIMKEGPRIQQGLSPDQMRRLLQAVQSIDADAADVMARQVRRIDAHFVAGNP